MSQQQNGSPDQDVSTLLRAWSEGDHGALDQLAPIVYRELHRLARYYMSREQAQQTLQPTALIHEAFIRLVDQNLPTFQCRVHFFRIASQVMRQVLIDFARKRKSDPFQGSCKMIEHRKVQQKTSYAYRQ